MRSGIRVFTAASALCILLCAPPAKAVSCPVRHTPMSPGDIAISHNDYARAESLYAEEMKAPGSEGDRAHAAMIRAQLRQSKVADAEKDALAWSSAQRSNSWALVALTEVRWRQGRSDEAIRISNQLRALDPCNPQAHADLATIFRMRGFYASASRELSVARQLDPVDDAIESDWIRLQSRTVQLQEITRYLERATWLSAEERSSLLRWKDRLSQPPAAGCHLATSVAGTTIPFRAIQNGPNVRTEWGLEVNLNGTQRRLAIDTGASGLVLTRAAANALHLTPEHSFKSWGVGDDPDVDSFVAKVDSIKIGDLEFQDCDVQVLGKTTRALQASDGLIGGDVFSRFLLTLDFPGRILKLDPLPPRPGTPADKSSPSLQTGVSPDPGEPQDPVPDPSMKDWTRIWRAGHQLLIPVRLNDKGPVKLFIIDTGAQMDLISPDAAREVAKVSKGAPVEIYGVSGKVKDEYTTGPMKLYFANLVSPNDGMLSIDTSRMGRQTGVEISGFLGAPTLHQLTMSIDYRDNLVNFRFDPKRLYRCVGNVAVADCY